MSAAAAARRCRSARCSGWRSSDTGLIRAGLHRRVLGRGGMAAAMLAAYPAVFAAGGVVAGMPVVLRRRRCRPCCACGGATRCACASSSPPTSAPRRRRARPGRGRGCRSGRGARPHGEPGQCGGPGGAVERAARLGCRAGPSTQSPPGVVRRAWGRAATAGGRAVDPGRGRAWVPGRPAQPGRGRVGPWVVDAGLSAAQRIAAFWGFAAARR